MFRHELKLEKVGKAGLESRDHWGLKTGCLMGAGRITTFVAPAGPLQPKPETQDTIRTHYRLAARIRHEPDTPPTLPPHAATYPHAFAFFPAGARHVDH